MITRRSRYLGITLLYVPFLDNYQLYSGFERSFYFVIASFSNNSYYPIMQFVSFMMLRWENFQPRQLRSLWLSILWFFHLFCWWASRVQDKWILSRCAFEWLDISLGSLQEQYNRLCILTLLLRAQLPVVTVERTLQLWDDCSVDTEPRRRGNHSSKQRISGSRLLKAHKVLSRISTQGQYVLGENGSISYLKR